MAKKCDKAAEDTLEQARSQSSDGDVELRLIIVMQDCADQLAVLGHIMSSTYKGRPDAEQVEPDEEEEMFQFEKDPLEIADTGENPFNRMSPRELRRALENKPVSPDNLDEVQHDRHFLAQVITDVLEELQTAGTFDSLLLAVEKEKTKKAHQLDIIKDEEEGRRRQKALQRQLANIRKEKARELHRREDIIAHLKDQLQEMKVKAGLERDYMASTSQLQVDQGQEHNAHKEKEMEEEVRRLEEKIEEEKAVHEELVNFLKQQAALLEEKLEVWMDCYERDIEEKQKEIDMLKEKRAANMEEMQELQKKVEQDTLFEELEGL
ncbi:dynein regulatory complex protein 9-like [Megalops cyprinoides]|uniref:dynein regulatory complex protein 9-like n=1 Tax=Megalops cyprinoides TaxID=118141 RepID=UPI001864DA0A|nr:dynein regulatory complex protein 9-like [Megalops cyprinoides]